MNQRTLYLFLFIWFCGCLRAQSQLRDTFTDMRDGKTYRITAIGNQIWMAENLQYNNGGDCYFYENASYYGAKYGLLYGWKMAVNGCPIGWKLPSNNDWEILAQAISMLIGPFAKDSLTWEGVGNILKSNKGWPDNGNGTDDFQFSALPAGYKFARGTYYSLNFSGYFWTSDTTGQGDGIYRYLNRSSNCFFQDNDLKIRAFSVRCVMENDTK